MTTFWSLLRESVLVQGVITFALIGAVIYLSVTGQEVSDLIASLTLLVVGFYFGSKVENATTKEVVKKYTEGNK